MVLKPHQEQVFLPNQLLLGECSVLLAPIIQLQATVLFIGPQNAFFSLGLLVLLTSDSLRATFPVCLRLISHIPLLALFLLLNFGASLLRFIHNTSCKISDLSSVLV